MQWQKSALYFITVICQSIGPLLSPWHFVAKLELIQECPTFFDSRAILAHQKYWRAKQIIHFNFRPKIKVFSKKKSSLEYSFIFFNFRPKIKVFSKKKRSSLEFSFIFFNFRPKIKAFSKKKVFTCIELHIFQAKKRSARGICLRISAKMGGTELFEKSCAGHGLDTPELVHH